LFILGPDDDLLGAPNLILLHLLHWDLKKFSGIVHRRHPFELDPLLLLLLRLFKRLLLLLLLLKRLLLGGLLPEELLEGGLLLDSGLLLGGGLLEGLLLDSRLLLGNRLLWNGLEGLALS
jgi:hypothetical protein